MTTKSVVPHHARVDVADVLRGLSVLAIILLHSIEHFNFYSFPPADSQPQWLTFMDGAVWDGLFFMFAGKAYAIFALLFGFSFFIQDDNQRLKGRDFRLRFCWRLLLLFVIGNINAMFFTAEILVLYSLVGFVLVVTCRMSTRSLVWIAGFLLLQPVALYNIARALIDPSYVAPSIPTGELWDATFRVQSSGTFWETVRVNLWEGQLASLAWAWDHGRVFQTAGLFILGMLMGRNGWLLKDKLYCWRRVAAVAVVAFAVFYSLRGMLPSVVDNAVVLKQASMVVKSLSDFSFMLVLVSCVLFAYYCTKGKLTLEKIIPYGRMSMTNYVTQSMIGSMMYYNWGFGLHAYMGITASVCAGVVLFMLQLKFCKYWMARHSHGPFEYAWKRATWAW